MIWAREEIDKAVGPRLNQQKGYFMEERRLHALRENDFAQSLERQRAEAQGRFKRLLFYANRMESVASAYQNLSNVKSRKRLHD